MSLKFLVDEDTQDKLLIKLLRQAGHEVLSVNEANLMGEDDPIVLNYALRNQRIVLTYNCDDFEELHEASSQHSGIIGIYRDDKYFKNMSFKQIVKAIANLEAAQIPVAGQFVNLNQWNY